MRKYQQPERIAAEHNGVLATTNALVAGVSKDIFKSFITENQYERVCRGIYLAPNAMEIQVYKEAWKQYARRKEKKLHRLMDYAEKFHVAKIVREYRDNFILNEGMLVTAMAGIDARATMDMGATFGGSGMGKTNTSLAPRCKSAKLLDGKVFRHNVGHMI